MRTSKSLSLAAIAMLLCSLGLLIAQQGPTREVETVAKPRKSSDANTTTPAEPTGEKLPSKFSKKAGAEAGPNEPVFKTDVTAVQVDVAVLDNQGHFIPNIPRGNFRVLEDNVPQQITEFSVGEAPMTVTLVIEFSNLFQQYWTETWYQTLTAAYGFLETLKPDDYVAVVAYDLKPEILTDFTTDKREAYDAMKRLQFAAYSESNLFDALTDTADRMSDIEGRKAIVVVASGIDTFSKITLGETRRKLQTAGVPIYAIGLMQAIREWADANGAMGSIQRLEFLQADNQMRTFAKETGGQAFFPRFYGEFPEIFGAISSALRNKYSLAYHPTNQTKDGKFRKIKVELVDPATGKPLRVVDQNQKPIKYEIVARGGYTAPRPVE